MVSDVFTRLTKVIDCEEDHSGESSCTESLREMVEESKLECVNDLSLSLINRQIGS